jgi:hypothetical protein
MNKKLIRLTENDLHKIVKESVEMILKEDSTYDAMIKARKFYNSFNDFISIVKKANEEVKGYYADKIETLMDALKIVSDFAYPPGGGNEGSGFSSNGIGYF